jgi:hypothetical protein
MALGRGGAPGSGKQAATNAASDKPVNMKTEDFMREEFVLLNQIVIREMTTLEDEFHGRISRIEQRLAEYRALKDLIADENFRASRLLKRRFPESKAQEIQAKRRFL